MNKGTRQLVMGLIYIGGAIYASHLGNEALEKSDYIIAIIFYIAWFFLVKTSAVLINKSTK